jgi:hypothetical protein
VPGIGANYTTIAEAVDAAQAGDTIHIEGSVTPYTGDVIVDKKLVIIGPGYFLAASPQTQHYKESAKINCNITFAADSEGSILAGIEHRTGATGYTVSTTGYVGNKVIIQTNDISIISCKLFYVEVDAAQNRNNIFIQRCFFNPGVITTAGGTGVISNLTIANSFFRNDFSTRIVISCPAGSPAAWRISQCTFYNNFVILGLSNTTFVSNAFYGVASGNSIAAGINNSFNNNVTNVDNIGFITGVNDNALRTDAVASWFSQAGTSDAIDIFFKEAGNTTSCPLYDGGPMRGMYGGAQPYKESGMFTIPSVYEIRMDIEVGDSFDMTIRARTHY